MDRVSISYEYRAYIFTRNALRKSTFYLLTYTASGSKAGLRLSQSRWTRVNFLDPTRPDPAQDQYDGKQMQSPDFFYLNDLLFG